jgi:hypothetical protein
MVEYAAEGEGETSGVSAELQVAWCGYTGENRTSGKGKEQM